MGRSLACRISSRLQAIENCKKSDNKEWLDKHADSLMELCNNELPHGSGIDHTPGRFNGLDIDESTPQKLVIYTSFHHMNEGGLYDGWTEHRIIVTPEFDGVALKISGRDRNDIKSYLCEVYHHALTTESAEF